MEFKDYERHSKTITIPPAHVALRGDIRLPIWKQERVTHGIQPCEQWYT
jgi:hypothetical protein